MSPRCDKRYYLFINMYIFPIIDTFKGIDVRAELSFYFLTNALSVCVFWAWLIFRLICPPQIINS